VILPGSMAENGKGYEVTLKTDWTGDIFDRSYFTEKNMKNTVSRETSKFLSGLSL